MDFEEKMDSDYDPHNTLLFFFLEYGLYYITLHCQVHGEYSSTKPMLGDQYLHFEQGSLLSSCTKTNKYRPHLFMPHHSLQVSSDDSMYVCTVLYTCVLCT